MRTHARETARLIVAQADIMLAALSLFFASWLRDHVLPNISSVWYGQTDFLPRYPILFLGSIPLLLGCLYGAGAYKVNRLQGPAEVLSAILKSLVYSTVCVMALAFALRDQTFSRAIVTMYLVMSHVMFFLVRLVAPAIQNAWVQKGGLETIVIVGTAAPARALARSLRDRRHLGYRLAGYVTVEDEDRHETAVPLLGDVWDLPQIVDDLRADAVIFSTSLDRTAKYEAIIWKLEEVGTTVHLRGDAIGSMLSRTLVGELDGMPIVTLRSTPSDPISLALKRGIDFIGSSLGLVLLSPVFLVAALLVRLTSPGPVLHRQERLGLRGKRFQMLKFRSMFIDAEHRLAALQQHNEMTGPVFKMTNDPRVTAVGRWLRRFSIDELPQLWNVWIGQMSLVGPRPPLAAEVVRYERWQRRRLSMKPGLTCLWQVNGRNDLDFTTWMKLDMEYIDNWSLRLDLKILLKTIPAILTARGAR